MAYRSGGTRGGADQFRWDDVKQDKYRESYLGHSLHAPVGRWQKGKDLTWYAKKGEKSTSVVDSEIEIIRKQDEDLIRQALGQAPIKRPGQVETLQDAELKQLLAKGASEHDDVYVERVSGLGAAPAKGHDHLQQSLAERELSRRARAAEPHRLHESDIVKVIDYPVQKEESEHTIEKQKRKAAKKEKKERKREKKAMKKVSKKEEKKRKKRKRDYSSDSSSSSSKSDHPVPRRKRCNRSSSPNKL